MKGLIKSHNLSALIECLTALLEMWIIQIWQVIRPQNYLCSNCTYEIGSRWVVSVVKVFNMEVDWSKPY